MGGGDNAKFMGENFRGNRSLLGWRFLFYAGGREGEEEGLVNWIVLLLLNFVGLRLLAYLWQNRWLGLLIFIPELCVLLWL